MRTVLITDQAGSTAHCVEDAQIGALAVGLHPEAVCGRVFAPAALCTPDGLPCALCREVLRARERSRRPTAGLRAALALVLAPSSARAARPRRTKDARR